MMKTTPEQIAAVVPAGWDYLFSGWRLDLDWAAKGLPALNEKLYNSIADKGDGYSLFGFFTAMLFFKGCW